MSRADTAFIRSYRRTVVHMLDNYGWTEADADELRDAIQQHDPYGRKFFVDRNPGSFAIVAISDISNERKDELWSFANGWMVARLTCPRRPAPTKDQP